MQITTHVGKIGRLPRMYREEVGRRLEDGEPAAGIVKWLNSQPAVREILRQQFEGRPISEQNLSEWRRGGHVEWLRWERSIGLAARMAEESQALDTPATRPLADRFAGVMAAQLADLAMTMMDNETSVEKRWEQFCQVHQQLSQMRHDDHCAATHELRRKKWDHAMQRKPKEQPAN